MEVRVEISDRELRRGNLTLDLRPWIGISGNLILTCWLGLNDDW